MKEAAGEANLTVVAIILIATVVAIATPLVSSLMKGQVWKSCCTDQGGVVKGTSCEIYENGNLIETRPKNDMVTENYTCVQINEEKK